MAGVSKAARVQTGQVRGFSAKFGELVEAVGLSQTEYAEVLSSRLGRRVSQVVLSNWLRGRRPRSTGPDHDAEGEVLAAAKSILEDEGGAPARIGAEQVQAAINAWLAKGLTLAQIRISGEVSETLLRSWADGKVAVMRHRWESFSMKVDHWADIIVESQLAWQVEAEVRQRLARAKKMVGRQGVATLAEAYEKLRAAELIAEASSAGPS